MSDLKTTQQVFNLVFRDQDGGLLDTLTSEQAILGLVLDETSGRLKVQVAGGIGRSGHKLGSWSDEYEYNPGDIVNYDGGLYKCILPGTGYPPDTSTTYWAPYSDGALGEKYVRATWYQEISSASGEAGAIRLPPDTPSAEFVFNEWPDGIDAVLCGLDADGRPDETTMFTAGGDPVYVPASGGLSGDGAYTLSGVPAALPCAFVYRYRCKLRDFDEHYALRGCDFEQGLEPDNVLGTAGQITVTHHGDHTLTLSIPDPATLGDLTLPAGKVLRLETIQAVNGNGLDLTDDSGAYGLTIQDGGRLEAKGSSYANYLKKVISSNMVINCGLASGDFTGENALSQALASLDDYEIPPDVTVTFQLTDEAFGLNTPLSTIYLTHPNISRMVIKGNSADAAAFDIAGAANAPSGDSIYIPAATYGPSDFVPGGNHQKFVVYVAGSTGNDGAYRVIGATTAGTDIRLEMEAGTVKDATKDGVLYLLPSNHCQLVFGNNNGIVVITTGALQMNGLSLLTDGTDSNRNAIISGTAGATIAISRIIFSGFSNAVTAANGAALTYVSFPTLLNCNVALTRVNGFTVNTNASAFLNFNVVSGAASVGFCAYQGGQIRALNSVASRCGIGFKATESGTVIVSGSTAHHNITGYRSVNNSLINRTSSHLHGNTSDYDPAETPPRESANGGWII